VRSELKNTVFCDVCRVDLVWTDVSEERIASTGATCSWIFLPWRWRQYIPPKRRFTQDLHATSQKTVSFILTAVKTSNPTEIWVFVAVAIQGLSYAMLSTFRRNKLLPYSGYTEDGGSRSSRNVCDHPWDYTSRNTDNHCFKENKMIKHSEGKWREGNRCRGYVCARSCYWHSVLKWQKLRALPGEAGTIASLNINLWQQVHSRKGDAFMNNNNKDERIS
jgi:hypothetical protein